MQNPFGCHAPQGAFADADSIGAMTTRVMVPYSSTAIAKLDNTIRNAQQFGIRVVPSLICTSAVGQQTGPPSIPSEWVNFIKSIVERYDADGRNDMPGLKYAVDEFEVENEWMRQWEATTPKYVEHLKRTYSAIKTANPSAKVIASGVTGVDSFACVDGLLTEIEIGQTDAERRRVSRSAILKSPQYKAARAKADVFFDTARDFFDVADFHIYSTRPEEIGACATWMLQQMSNRGYSKLLDCCEAASPFFDWTEERFAMAVVKMTIIGIATGCRKVLWSSLLPTAGWSVNYLRTALVDANDSNTAAFHTYGLMTEKLADIESISEFEGRPENTAAYLAKTPAGPVVIAWSTTSEQTVSFPTQWPAARVTQIVTDRTKPIPASAVVQASGGKISLKLSGRPVFVEREG